MFGGGVFHRELAIPQAAAMEMHGDAEDHGKDRDDKHQPSSCDSTKTHRVPIHVVL
jgi:hypothetical protein